MPLVKNRELGMARRMDIIFCCYMRCDCRQRYEELFSHRVPWKKVKLHGKYFVCGKRGGGGERGGYGVFSEFQKKIGKT